MNQGPDADPPRISAHHVRLPEQVASLLGADRAHNAGITGKGAKIAVIDSGFFPHPYYLLRGYRVRYIPTRSEPRPDIDEYGHGTAHLASLFAVAPEAEVLAIKCLERDPSEAVLEALRFGPHVLNCAWGFDIDHPKSARHPGVPERYRRLHEILRDAHRQGVSIVAAAGNGQRCFPASMPETLAVGGIHYTSSGHLIACNASSHFESALFPGRAVPDICGLAGSLPHGRLLLVPVPPRARLARRRSCQHDELQRSRGWAMFSGTSAACSMISGALGLLQQVNPGLDPDSRKRIVLDTARIVESKGLDRLVDAGAAVELARAEQGRPGE